MTRGYTHVTQLAERAFAVYPAGLRELVLQRLIINELRVLADHIDTIPGN